jgi:uncharacterized protein YbjT (DUF2867 family)
MIYKENNMILVVGATGNLGGMITRRLLEQGNKVRILVRRNSPSEQLALQGMATSAQTLIVGGAQPVFGDLKDPASLTIACKGIETIITTANSAMRSGDDTVDSVDLRGNHSLIKAAIEAGVKQFVFISFFGASPDNPVPLFQAKAETEKFIIESGIPYTILSPNYFIESWVGMVVGIPLQTGKPITLVGNGQRLHSLISMKDVTAFTVAVVNNQAAINQKLYLGGPEPVCWRGIVEAFGKVLGNELHVQYVSLGTPIPGLPEMVPAVLAGMETYDSPIPMEQTALKYGVEMTPLSSTIRSMLHLPVAL